MLLIGSGHLVVQSCVEILVAPIARTPRAASWPQVSGGVAVSDWAPHDGGALVAPIPSALAGRPRPRQLYVAGTRAQETVTNASDVGLTAANGAVLTDFGITTPSKVNSSWWSALRACVLKALHSRRGFALFLAKIDRARAVHVSHSFFATQHSPFSSCPTIPFPFQCLSFAADILKYHPRA